MCFIIAGTIIDDIFNGTLNASASVAFISPEFEKSSTPGAVVLYMIFGVIIALGFVHSGKKWLRQCKNI